MPARAQAKALGQRLKHVLANPTVPRHSSSARRTQETALFAVECDLNVRAGAPHVMMVLSDGEQTVAGDPVLSSAAVKASGALLFAVGFGGVSQATLDAMASIPAATFAIKQADLTSLAA